MNSLSVLNVLVTLNNGVPYLMAVQYDRNNEYRTPLLFPSPFKKGKNATYM